MDTPLNLAVHCLLYDDNDLCIHAQIINAFTFKHWYEHLCHNKKSHNFCFKNHTLFIKHLHRDHRKQ